jgi:tetratricopeptide (TPR) repeat protein
MKEKIIMRNNRRQYTLAIALVAIIGGVAAMPATAQAAEVRASLSSAEAYVGMPITVHVEVSSSEQHDPPSMPEIDGVDVRSSGAASRRSQTTIINGHRTQRSSVTYAWQMTPRRSGEFVIPSMQVSADGRMHTTQAMRFVANKSETGDLMFVEVDGKSEKIFVGQSLKLTLHVWLKPYRDARHDVTLSEGDMWQLIDQEQSNWGAFAKAMTQMQQERKRPAGQEVLRENSQGSERSYYRYDIEATIYPKRPGQVDSGNLQIVTKYPTGLTRSRNFFSMGELAISGARPIVADATVAPIEVLPIPTVGRPADYRGTVGQYEMITQAAPTHVKAGDPITLHIGIRGDGPMELVQAPPLADLPKLTGDFKVPDEALAGRVKDDVKVFTVSIRPRHEGITEIPSIPLTYFNPETEKFVTVQSEPIAIQVEAADQLALASIVGKAGNHVSDKTETSEADVIYLKNHAGSDILQSATPRSLWTLAMWLIAAPMMFLIACGFKYRETIMARITGTRVAAKRRAHAALAAADTSHCIATAVLSYISELHGLSKAALTRGEAMAYLQQQTSMEDAEQIDRLLARCEANCYAGESQTDISELKTEAADCIEKLSKSKTQMLRKSAAQPSSAMGRKQHSAAATAGCLLAVAMLFGAASVVQATELSADQAGQILAEADSAYTAGQAATEPADAKESFALAAKKYQTLVDDGVENGKLYFNLGNAYLQLGHTARALANYERASDLLPSDHTIERNREHAQQQLGIAPLSHGVIENAKVWISGLSPQLLTTTALISWVAMWAAMIAVLFIQRRVWKRIAIPAGLCCAACVALIGYQDTQLPTHDRAMIIAEAAELRSGNGETFAPTTGQPLQVGSQLQVVEQRGAWYRVQSVDGQVGWIAGDEAELLPARGWRG